MIRLLTCALLLGASALATFGFNVLAEQEEIPERGLVLRYRVVNGADAFAFLPPATWAVQKDDAQKQIVFRSESLQASVTLRFSTHGATNATLLKAAIQEGWPKAVFEDLGECHARDRKGPALEFVYVSANSVIYRSRVAVLDYGSTKVELTLTAPEDNFGKGHHIWTSILNSFARSEQKTAARP